MINKQTFMGGTFDRRNATNPLLEILAQRVIFREFECFDQLASSTSFPGNDYYLSKSVVFLDAMGSICLGD
jgi:hypothetical protein